MLIKQDRMINHSLISLGAEILHKSRVFFGKYGKSRNLVNYLKKCVFARWYGNQEITNIPSKERMFRFYSYEIASPVSLE